MTVGEYFNLIQRVDDDIFKLDSAVKSVQLHNPIVDEQVAHIDILFAEELLEVLEIMVREIKNKEVR